MLVDLKRNLKFMISILKVELLIGVGKGILEPKRWDKVGIFEGIFKFRKLSVRVGFFICVGTGASWK
jgi:hypothetical protein